MTSRIAVAVFTALAGAVGVPGIAHAEWTPALPVPQPAGMSWQAQAVSARGDLALAGVKTTRLGRGGIAARATVVVTRRRTAGGGFRTETVASAHRVALAELAIALDRRGDPTMTWVQRRGSRRTVMAAYRARAGRWTTQTVGPTSAFFNAAPRVAAAPNGTVAVTYYAAAGRTPGMAAAWRTRTGRFGTPQALRVGSRHGAYLTEPTLTFDRDGRALLAGAAACGQAPSTGVLYRGSARTRRFSAGRVVAPAPAKSVRLAIAPDGTPVVAWLTGNCTPGSEVLTGTPMAAVVRSGAATPPTALVDDSGYRLVLAGAPGGATATWGAAEQNDVLLAATIRSDGTVTPAQAPDDNWVPVVASPSGDQLLRQVSLTGTTPFEPLAARRADSGAIEPAPVPASGFAADTGMASAPDGRVFAAFTITTEGPRAAVWRP